jgi:hypothetical protein
MATPEAEATDPTTTPQRLGELASAHPHLGARISAHPNAYPELRQWIAANGGPASVRLLGGLSAPLWCRVLLVAGLAAALSTLLGAILLGVGGGYHGYDPGPPRGLFVAGIVFVAVGLGVGLAVLGLNWFGPGRALKVTAYGRRLELSRIVAFAATVGSFTAMVSAFPIISQWLANV